VRRGSPYFSASSLSSFPDAFLELLVLVLQLLALQRGQPAQGHVQDGLGLHLGELEALDEVLLGRVRGAGAADDGDDLVEEVQGQQQTFQDMGPFPGLA